MSHARTLAARSRSLTSVERCCFRFGPSPHDGGESKRRSPAGNDSIQLNVFPCCVGTSAWPAFARGSNRLPAYTPQDLGFVFGRYVSTQVGDDVLNGEILSDVAGVVSDKTADVLASQEPVLSEVAVAAADSYLPVAALQYLIDSVHSFTGLNWFAGLFFVGEFGIAQTTSDHMMFFCMNEG